MQIAIASDHAGFSLKEEIRTLLEKKGYEVTDFGAHSEERTDYPDFARLVAHAVSSGKAERGVLICGTGIGMCMAANRVLRVRAAVLRDNNDATISREHNDANIACLGGRITKPEKAAELLEIFLTTPFEGGRHQKRVEKLR